MIAARVAANLEHDPNLAVETVKGGLGELSVDLDGTRIYTGSRLWYPTPTSVIKKVRDVLAQSSEKQ
jgi:hypothetical protein